MGTFNDIIFVLLPHVILAIQESSLTFVDSVFSANVLELLKIFTFFRLDFDGDIYIAVFLVLVVGTAVYVVVTVIFMLAEIDILSDTMCAEYIWFFIGDSLLFGVLLIPTSRTLISIFHCEDGVLVKSRDMICWEGIHIFYVCAACVCGLAIAIGAILKTSSRNRELHSASSTMRMKQSVQHFDSFLLPYRLTLVVLSVLLANTHTTLRKSIISMAFIALSSTLLTSIFIKLPHLDIKFNLLKSMMCATSVWSFVCTLIEVLTPPLGTYFMIGYPIIIICTYFVTVSRTRFLSNVIVDTEKHPENEMLKYDNPMIRNYMHKYDVLQEKCAIVEFSDNQSFKTFIETHEKRTDLQMIIVKKQTSQSTSTETWDVDINKLLSLVPFNLSLQAFCINGVSIVGESAQSLVDQLNGHPSLRVVDLFNNQIDNETALFIAQGLSATPNLTRINLGDNEIDAEGRDLVQRVLENIGAKYKALF